MGWTDIDEMDELLQLSEPPDHLDVSAWDETHLQYRTLAVATLRRTVQFQQQTKPLPLAQLEDTLATLGRLATAVRSLMGVVLTLSSPKPARARELGMLHLPLILEAALLRQARKWTRGRSLPLYQSHQRRFLRFMRDIIDRADQEMPNADTTHLGGALLELLELEPGWLELLLEGARQFGAGKGPLMGAGVVRKDLIK